MQRVEREGVHPCIIHIFLDISFFIIEAHRRHKSYILKAFTFFEPRKTRQKHTQPTDASEEESLMDRSSHQKDTAVVINKNNCS